MPSYRPQAKTRPGSVGPLRGQGLGERLPGGRGHDQPGAGRPDGVQRPAPRLGPHDHARPAAVRGVVDGAVHVVGPLPQVVDADAHQAALGGLAQQRLAQRGEVLGEDRDDVDLQGHAHSSSRPSGGSTTRKPPRGRRSARSPRRTGSARRRPPARRTTSRSWASCRTAVTSPSTGVVGQPRGQADQLVVVEGVGVLDLGEIGHRRRASSVLRTASAASRLSYTSPDGRELEQQGAAVPVHVRRW